MENPTTEKSELKCRRCNADLSDESKWSCEESGMGKITLPSGEEIWANSNRWYVWCPNEHDMTILENEELVGSELITRFYVIDGPAYLHDGDYFGGEESSLSEDEKRKWIQE